MSKSLPSLDLIARRVDAEHDAHIRHADALDAKAGIVLGFSGALAAIGRSSATPLRIAGLTLAVVAALAALGAIVPARFPTWRLTDLRDYVRAEPELTRVVLLDTTIVMIQQMKTVLERKALRLKVAVVVLTLAISISAAGTLFD